MSTVSQAVLTFSVKPEALTTHHRNFQLKSIVETSLKIVNGDDKVYYCNEKELFTRESCNSHGLIGTIARAYSSHVPLVLRPDDVWNAIVVAFAKYVTMHPEDMRPCFVSHSGKEKLVVTTGGCFATSNWPVLLNSMKNEIEKHVDPKIATWLEPNFTTTTEVDKLISNISLMGAMQNYFSYELHYRCGLSSVTLKGDLEDWKNLVIKAQGLRQYGQDILNEWADLLIPVLEKIVESYQLATTGQPLDEEFWQRICIYAPRASGVQKTSRGWFLVFAPFSVEGEYLLNPKEEIAATNIYAICDDKDILPGCVTVPVTIDDNGNVFETKFFAGSVSMMYDKINNTIFPGTDWGICINGKH